jgi:hypothetical protein
MAAVIPYAAIAYELMASDIRSFLWVEKDLATGGRR